ncbi:MAG: MtrB/PioB family decaheme-associated outer membrane protein [Sterolibacterium sp.]|nr:MtrB/PioB family decaheme-associated outer membrane protein [Sterolibacterium sp.]
MNLSNHDFSFKQQLLVLAMLAAFPAAQADEAAIAQLSKPETTLSIGAAGVSGDSQDRAIFGQYNGFRKDSGRLLLDADVIQRDDASGTWMILQGRNLGLDNAELGATYWKQGDWKVSAEYNEITRHDPRTINSGLLNAGTATPSVSLVAPAELNLDTKRKGVLLSTEKWLTPSLQFEASFKNEDKDGARLFGRGIACGAFAEPRNACGAAAGAQLANSSTAFLMLPEPIHTTTKQLEAKLNYSGEKFLLSGGYNGSLFSNSNGSLNPVVNGSLWNSSGTLLSAPGATLQGFLQQPMALAPDNEAHQLYLSGNYAFTPTTRATFKYAYTHATQNQDFAAQGLTGAPAGINNLGGEVNTTLAQFGLTARPMPKLSLIANLRYEDKQDKTPIALYNLTGLATPANYFTNTRFSSEKLTGKLEATYQLPDNYRATLGVDYQTVNRDRPVNTTVIGGLSALREETREEGYRAELRRTMSETLNAGISYVYAKREGSSWLSVAPGAGFPAVSDAAIYNRYGSFPMTLEDRQRDKVKLSADWTPFEALSLQFMLEDGKDTYTGPTEKGLRDTGMKSYGVDAAWKISDAWKLTGYLNQGRQTLHIDHSTGYLAELENINTSIGFGVLGKPSAKLEVGGDLSYLDDNNHYRQGMSNGAALAGGGLPDVKYRLTTLKLFGKYALEKNVDFRIDLAHQRARLEEWTWGYNGVPFAYSDNTSVGLQPNQSVTYLGATYIYRMR